MDTFLKEEFAQKPAEGKIDPAEMYIWSPPTPEQLEARARRQKKLDKLSRELQQLYMVYADTLGEEIILENLIYVHFPKLKSMEESVAAEIIDTTALNKENQQELEALKKAAGEIDAEIMQVRAERERRRYREDDYFQAILLFRDGRYKDSAALFKKILKTDFPPTLHDNILFGLGANYFKLKQYSRAVRSFRPIVKKFPREDKWMVSHAMLGLVYSLQGKNSKAILVVKQALSLQPSRDLRIMLERVLSLAQGELLNAAS